MRNNSDPTAFASYHSVLRDIDLLIEYLERMARHLADAEARAVQISRELGGQIEDHTRLTRYRSSSAFML